MTELLLFFTLEPLGYLECSGWGRITDSARQSDSLRTERLLDLCLYLVCMRGLAWVQELAEAERGLEWRMVAMGIILLF